MGTIKRVSELCDTIRQLGVPLEYGRKQEVLLPNASDHRMQCEQKLALWTRTSWNINLLHYAKSYANKRNFPIIFYAPDVPYSGRLSFSTVMKTGGRIGFGLGTTIPLTQKRIELGVDHEVGHLTDYEYLAELEPSLKQPFSTGEWYSTDDTKLVNTIYFFLEQHVPPKEQEIFKKRYTQIFGDISSLDKFRLSFTVNKFIELLRYGAEVNDRRYLQEFKDITPPVLRHGFVVDNWFFQIKQLLVLGKVLETPGLWNVCKRKADFDSEIINRVSKEEIWFFQTAIRAAFSFSQKKIKRKNL